MAKQTTISIGMALNIQIDARPFENAAGVLDTAKLRAHLEAQGLRDLHLFRDSVRLGERTTTAFGSDTAGTRWEIHLARSRRANA